MSISGNNQNSIFADESNFGHSVQNDKNWIKLFQMIYHHEKTRSMRFYEVSYIDLRQTHLIIMKAIS